MLFRSKKVSERITTRTAAQTLESLLTQDTATGGDKWLDSSWKGAEAYHFLLLCQRQLYAGYPAEAMRTALRLREYEAVLPAAEIYSLIALTTFYSIGAIGIAVVNDFKSIEGDRALGLKSLPVAFGIDGAKYICAGMIDVTQISVAAYLYYIGLHTYAAVLGCLIAPQIWAQTQYLLKDPVKYDVKYQGTAQPFQIGRASCRERV